MSENVNKMVKLFLRDARILFFYSVFSSVFSYFICGLDFGFIDDLDSFTLVEFPGLLAMSHNSPDPQVWRMCFLLNFVLVLVSRFFYIFRASQLIREETFKRSNFDLLKLIVLGLGIFCLCFWFVFFSTKPWTMDVMSRGALILVLFNANPIGLILGAYVFMFLMALGLSTFFIGVTLFLRSKGSASN